MGIYEALLLGAGGVYLGAILWLWAGVGRRPRPGGGQPRVSVVVAARNEAENIRACLEALRAQDYQGEWEVVVVDDRSTDQTARVVAAHAWERVKLVRAPEERSFRCPKKSALAQGIASSFGEVLLFTDADCLPPPQWVRATAGLFTEGVGLVAGHAFPAAGPGLRHQVLALDNLAVGALGAGSIGMGAPLSCTGRNLAYCRQVYQEVGGFTSIGHLVGGDDVYFLRLVARTKWKVVYNPVPIACAPGPEGWRVLQQKLRHASKAGHYQGPALALAGAVYLFHLLLLIGLVQLARGQVHEVFFGVWGARCLADLALLGRFAPRPQERRLLVFLPLLELLYIPYVLVFSVVGRLGWFRWKG